MIYICSLAELPKHAEALRPSHIVSMLAEEDTFPATPLWIEDGQRHLRMAFHDIADPMDGLTPPGESHVRKLLDFADAWDRSAPLIVHCYAGISRSTAAALIMLCRRNPRREAEAARLLRERAPHAQPNRRMIALADGLLESDGRLVAAVEAMGPARLAPYGCLVELPAVIT